MTSRLKWCAKRESNPRPSHSECATLSPELLAQNIQYIYIINFALVKDKFFDRHRKDSSAEYDKSLILFSKAGEEKATLRYLRRRLKEPEPGFFISYQTVTAHFTQFGRHGAAVHTKEIRQFLTVKRNREFGRSGSFGLRRKI